MQVHLSFGHTVCSGLGIDYPQELLRGPVGTCTIDRRIDYKGRSNNCSRSAMIRVFTCCWLRLGFVVCTDTYLPG